MENGIFAIKMTKKISGLKKRQKERRQAYWKEDDEHVKQCAICQGLVSGIRCNYKFRKRWNGNNPYIK